MTEVAYPTPPPAPEENPRSPGLVLRPKALLGIIEESKAISTITPGSPKTSRSSTPTGRGGSVALNSTPLTSNELSTSTKGGDLSSSRPSRESPQPSPLLMARKRMSGRMSLTPNGGGLVPRTDSSDEESSSSSINAIDLKTSMSSKWKAPRRMFGKGLSTRNSIAKGKKGADLDAEDYQTGHKSHLTPGSAFRVDMGSMPLNSTADLLGGGGVKMDVSFADCTNVVHICDGCNSNLFKGDFEGKPVIIKRLKIERINMPHVFGEFEFESEFLRRGVDCPHLVRIFASGVDLVSEFDLPEDVPFDPNSRLAVNENGERKVQVPFVIIERLTGGTLSFYLAKPRSFHSPPFKLLQVFEIWKQLATALDFLHDKFDKANAVIHRDLKPDNICFDEANQLRLIDFGLSICVNKAKSIDDVFEMTGCTGSLRYMSPEVASNMAYNDRADIYSFGIIAYETLTGVAPFGAMDRAAFFKRVVAGKERPQLNQDDYARTIRAPKAAKDLIAACWNHDFKLRPSAAEVKLACEALYEEQLTKNENFGVCRCS